MAKNKAKFNKFITGAVTATLVATAVAPAVGAASFTDTDKLDPNVKAEVGKAVDLGFFKDGSSFNPAGKINRSQAALTLARYLADGSTTADLKAYVEANDLEESVAAFKDVPASFKDGADYQVELYYASLIVKDAGAFTQDNLNPTGNVTRSQMAKIITTTFGLEKADGYVSKITDIDHLDAGTKGYIETIASLGVTNVTTFNPAGTVTRSQMASFLVRSNDVVNPEVVTATKVVSVSATNLKEVVVEFDGKVDKATAGDADYYSIVDDSNNDHAIKSAKVSEDLKSVTLTMDDGHELNNQEEFELSFDNIKAGDKVLSVKDYAFTPVDSSLPVAISVTALGNKTVKILFSEPIAVANTSHFLIDGTAVVGTTDVVGNTVILRNYSTLSNGSHKIEVQNVEDYLGFKSLSKEFTFNVVEDVTAPTIASVENATFEKVTLKFSEAIDPATVNPTTFYWLDGTTKKYAEKVTALSDDTFLIEFSSSSKLLYPTNLYVVGARDYSGNVIADDSKIQVTPVIDLTRPEVASANLNDTRNEITIKFNKALTTASAEDEDNYVIKDADGKEVSKLKNASLGSDNKTVTVSLVQALSQGKTYTLEVNGVSDNTTLKNVMMPYSKSLVVGDKTGPAATSVNVTFNYDTATGANSIYVNFPEKMAVSGDGSIVEKAKYMYFDGADWKALPSGARMSVTPDGKSAIITFPSNIPVTNASKVRVQLVKDVAGNYMQPLTEDFTTAPAVNAVLQLVEATANNKLVLTFSQNILANTVSASDFTVNAGGNKLNILTAEATDDKEITLTLADNSKLNANGTFGTNQTVTVDVKDSNVSTVTPAGKPVVDATAPGADIAKDKIKASLKGIVGGTTIAVQFNELLDKDSDGPGVENDFIIKNQNGAILPTSAYTVVVNEDIQNVGTDTVTISFSSTQSGVYTVELANPRYLEDAQHNKVAAFAATQVSVNAVNPAALTGVTLTDALGLANDGHSIANLPTAGTGNTFVYKVSGDANPVTAPFAGTVPSGYTAVADGDLITVADGTNVGVAEVDTNGKVVKFVNVVASNTDATAAEPAIKIADAVLGSNVAFDTATNITLNGQVVALTQVALLGAAYDAAGAVGTVVTALQADIDAVYDGNAHAGETFTVEAGSGADADKLIIKSNETGSTATVDLTGSDVATGATLLGFTTLTAVIGIDELN